MNKTLACECNSVGKTILSQMGGGARMKMFLGAKNFQFLEAGPSKNMPCLMFDFEAKSKNESNRFIVYLDYSKDTYEVEFWKNADPLLVADEPSVMVGNYDNVYADMLVDLFEDDTGLYLSF